MTEWMCQIKEAIAKIIEGDRMPTLILIHPDVMKELSGQMNTVMAALHDYGEIRTFMGFPLQIDARVKDFKVIDNTSGIE